MRILAEMLLDDGGEPVEALAHVDRPRRQPDPHAGRNADHCRPVTAAINGMARGVRRLHGRPRTRCGPHPEKIWVATRRASVTVLTSLT